MIHYTILLQRMTLDHAKEKKFRDLDYTTTYRRGPLLVSYLFPKCPALVRTIVSSSTPIQIYGLRSRLVIMSIYLVVHLIEAEQTDRCQSYHDGGKHDHTPLSPSSRPHISRWPRVPLPVLCAATIIGVFFFFFFFFQCLMAFEGFNIYEVHLCPVCRQGYDSIDPSSSSCCLSLSPSPPPSW